MSYVTVFLFLLYYGIMGFEIQCQYLQNQQESLSISPENSGERVDCVAFVFMHGYNESGMPV